MDTVDSVAALRARVRAWRQEGARIGFVPTMGNLHAGHLRLIAEARSRADRVVASIFVNPLQFGPQEDFGRYPRTLAADQAALTEAGCDLLFAPTVDAMYPRGQGAQTRIVVPGLAEVLEGAFRPGHFEGVATVVGLLFNQVQPDLACFGEKDYQQLAVIRRLVADLQWPVEIVGVPTARADDGLALSSRNQYLDAGERARAPEIHAVLQALATALRSGRRDYAALEAEGLLHLQSSGFVPQYLAIRRPDLDPADSADRAWVVLVAAHLGRTRLIDNLQVTA